MQDEAEVARVRARVKASTPQAREFRAVGLVDSRGVRANVIGVIWQATDDPAGRWGWWAKGQKHVRPWQTVGTQYGAEIKTWYHAVI